jgi:hypothetical protein
MKTGLGVKIDVVGKASGGGTRGPRFLSQTPSFFPLVCSGTRGCDRRLNRGPPGWAAKGDVFVLSIRRDDVRTEPQQEGKRKTRVQPLDVFRGRPCGTRNERITLPEGALR